MNAKKWLLVAGALILGGALFFAGTTIAQSDDGDVDREWSEMMGGEGWEYGSMHAWDDHPEHGAECPEYADHAGQAHHMDGWDGREHHGAMHGAYGDMMGDWVQPEVRPDAPGEDSGE